MTSLSDVELAMLAFERLAWRHAGSKESAIRERFDVTPTEYYRRLNALIDRPEALAHDPVLVNRLRLRREGGLRRRLAG